MRTKSPAADDTSSGKFTQVATSSFRLKEISKAFIYNHQPVHVAVFDVEVGKLPGAVALLSFLEPLLSQFEVSLMPPSIGISAHPQPVAFELLQKPLGEILIPPPILDFTPPNII